MTLKSRIETLEEKSVVDNELRGIFIEIIRAGKDGVECPEPDGYKYEDFAPTYRQEGETGEQLRKRALAQVAPFIPLAENGYARPVPYFRPLYIDEADTDV